MAKSYLMDSNVLIDYTSRKFPNTIEKKLDDIFDRQFYYSIISSMEVLGYNGPPEVLKDIEDFLSTGEIHHVTDEIAHQTILIRRLFPKIKLPDAIIASSALVYGHTFLTRNAGDFKIYLALILTIHGCGKI